MNCHTGFIDDNKGGTQGTLSLVLVSEGKVGPGLLKLVMCSRKTNSTKRCQAMGGALLPYCALWSDDFVCESVWPSALSSTC